MLSLAPRNGSVMVPTLVFLALVAALPLAMLSLVFALLIIAAAMLVILVAWLGLEGASTVLMVFAFALAPADKLGVSFLGVSDVFFFVAMGLVLPRLLRTAVSLPGLFLVGSLFFIAIGLVSSVAAQNPAVYYYTSRVIFTFVVLPVLVLWWAPRGKVLVWLLVAFAAGTILSVLYGIPTIGAYRNLGLTQHPNVLGYTATLTVSLVPFLFLALSPRWRLWICGAALGGAGIGILTSGSRAALVVAIFLIVMVPAVERSIPLALAVAIAGVVAVGAIGQRASPTEGQDALSRLLGAGDVTGSDQARTEGVERTWAVAINHPWLGTGFNFSDFIGHNVYVQVAAAVGFIGLGAFILLLLSMVTSIFATGNIHSRLVYPAIVFIVAGPVSPQLTDRYIGLLLGIALIGVMAVKGDRQFGDTQHPKAGTRRLSHFTGLADVRLRS